LLGLNNQLVFNIFQSLVPFGVDCHFLVFQLRFLQPIKAPRPPREGLSIMAAAALEEEAVGNGSPSTTCSSAVPLSVVFVVSTAMFPIEEEAGAGSDEE
jgi:hypothetical protein